MVTNITEKYQDKSKSECLTVDDVCSNDVHRLFGDASTHETSVNAALVQAGVSLTLAAD